MCCIFTILVFLGPRFGILFWWLLDPVRFSLSFGDNWVLPLLTFIFLPWTTLMYVVVAPLGSLDANIPAAGVQGLDWIWLLLAFLADLAAYSGGAYGNRRQIYTYVPAARPGADYNYTPYGPPPTPPSTPPSDRENQ